MAAAEHPLAPPDFPPSRNSAARTFLERFARNLRRLFREIYLPMTKRAVLVSIFASLPLLSGFLPVSAQPTLTFEPAPTVRGLTAGARVAWIGLGRISVDSGIEIRRFSGVDQDSDGDGVVPLAFEGDVPLRSVWIAVVLDSRETVAATPGEFANQSADLGLALLAGRTPGELAVSLERVHGLLVRPGTAPSGSAWAFAATDGGSGDLEEEPDGSVLLAADSFSPLGGSPALDAPRSGDVAIAIDVLALSYQIQTLGEVSAR